jgi:hypothetical protein
MTLNECLRRITLLEIHARHWCHMFCAFASMLPLSRSHMPNRTGQQIVVGVIIVVVAKWVHSTQPGRALPCPDDRRRAISISVRTDPIVSFASTMQKQ